MKVGTPGPRARFELARLPLICLFVLAAALLWSHWLSSDSQRWPGVRVAQAEAWVGESTVQAPPPGAAWQHVTLPDNWKLTRPEGPASVWYRIALDTSGIEAPAVLIPRLATAGQAWLNGARLWDGRPSSAAASRSWNAPLLLVLPESLLRPAGNTLLLQVSGPPRYRAGLSQVQLASSTELWPAYRLRQFWQHDGAMLSSAVSAVTGLLMIFVWMRMREVIHLCFGLATLFWVARNSNLFLDALPLSLDMWAAVVYLGHTWFNTLFGLFVLRFSGVRWHWVERILWLYAGANTVAVASGGLTSIEQAMRWMAAPAVPLYMLLVFLLLHKGWRERSTEAALMAATAITYVVLSQRDGLLLSGKLAYDGYYISHYTGVLMLASMTWSLVARLVSALQDVERLNIDLERRVEERTRALQTANAAKTRFLAAASHDLRQPVVTIGLMIGMLREQITAPALRGLIDRVDTAVASLEALLKGLLDLSRLDSGTVKPRIERVALQPLFDAIATHEHEAARLKGLRLRLRPTRLAVLSDPLLLEQILRNLVSNGLSHSERGGVLVGARSCGQHRVLLQVWDTGYGIPKEQQAAVFEEFVQLANPARDRARGLGLGLAIVKRCVRLLGSSLKLRSEPGRGSCFSFELPCAGDAAEGLHRTATPAQPLAGLLVLLVEDDPTVSESISLRLMHWGAAVRCYGDVPALREALAAPSRRVDLLITDNRLPVGSGLQAVELVRQRFGPIPALIVTGDTSPQEITLLIDSGLTVLHKPFRAEHLLVAIESAREAQAAPADGP